MATTATRTCNDVDVQQFSSAQFRRQIGLQKRQLEHRISAVHTTLSDYNIEPTDRDVGRLEDDEIESLRADLSSTKASLSQCFQKLTQLHSGWATRQEVDPVEQGVFDEYISKYGDYRDLIKSASQLLQQLQGLLATVDQEYNSRNPGVPLDSSAINHHVASKHQEFLQMSPPGSQAAQTSFLEGASAQGYSPLSNFVDASILSKMELPTFDGNLLDYPEFSARFATLVGNKPQLDDATKFSLLKSCLRGRALQSVQGLSVTAANYSIAMDILKTHYDDKVTMRHILCTKLSQLPVCDPEGRQLPQLYNRMFSLIRQFAHGDDSKEIALGAILLNKLPTRVRSLIYDKTSHSHNVTPSELLNLLTDIVRKETTLSEIEYHTRQSTDLTDWSTHQQLGFYIKSNTDATLPSTTKHRSMTNAKTCPYCSSPIHSAMDCNAYTTATQRKTQARNLQLCYNCLSSHHAINACPSKRSCRFCLRKHHSSLCHETSPQSLHANRRPSFPSSISHTNPEENSHYSPTYTQSSAPNKNHRNYKVPPSQPAQIPSVRKDGKETASCSTDQHLSKMKHNTTQAALMCTTVCLFNPDCASASQTVTAFLDSGSSKSYITNEIASTLKLTVIDEEDITVSTFGTKDALQLKCKNHNIGIHTEKGTKYLKVKSVPTLTGNLQQIHVNQGSLQENLTVSSCKPSILIGNDYFWDLILSENFYYQVLPNGYRLLHTTIGDIIINETLDLHLANYASVIVDEDKANPVKHDELSEQVANFWKLEMIGITDDPAKSDDEECLTFFNRTIFYDEEQKRYIVKLPFKTDPAQLPRNFSLAFSRLSSQVKALQRNPEYLEKYHDVIMDQAKKQIIEIVPPREIPKPSHYLSHHGVVKKAGNDIKVRCVYDGSAKIKGCPSLNDTLYRGPVLLPDLTGVLLRTRFQRILISSDVEKAFLMVGLSVDCRDYTRFLWLKDPTKPITHENLVTYRFTRVPFGLVSSPFLLAGTIHYHLENTATPIAKDILRNTYVDNVFYGVENTHEGIKFYNESKKLFQLAGMNLRAYTSNSVELNSYFDAHEGQKISKIQKLLGLQWDVLNDTFTISLPEPPPDSVKWTKRKILKCISSIYDPLGLLSPVILIGKLFLQSLWKIELSWDELLPVDQDSQWKQITSSWTTSSVTVPRLLFPMDDNPSYEYDLHVFTDASAQAYCAAAYIALYKEGIPSSVSLVMAKSRLSPLNQSITIPRLELAALMIGAKLITFLGLHLDIRINRTFLWSDSSVALTWIQSKKDLPVFVRNRVKIILENTRNVILRHIPGNLNPADMGSRGVRISDLLCSDTWWSGPSFILQKEEKWPQTSFEHCNPLPCSIVNETSSTGQDIVNCSKNLTTFATTSIKEKPTLLDVSRFSSWTKIVNSIMYVLKFLTRKSFKARSLFGRSKPALLSRAENILFRLAQSLNPPSDELKKQLKLFQCETTSLWKSRGRIEHSTLPPDAATPIFLPMQSVITKLYVLNVHQNNNHCGINHTLTLLRQRVWIPKGRTAVKTVIHNQCFHCKRYLSKPFTLPPFPNHPERRVKPPQYPFENVGMDFFGPIRCRTECDTTQNYWMILFTCLNCRAIYVDVILDMTAHTVLHVLRRFIATMGCPTWILSDNAQSFKTLNQCYSSLPNPHINEDVIDYCASRRILMKFIPSLSPWQGGFYEKMIDIFKKSFRLSIGNRILDIEDIRTIAKETEAIVNTRPLTYYSDDIKFFPLRPVDFIRPYTRLNGPCPQEYDKEWQPYEPTQQALLGDWKRTTEVVSMFWKRWSEEYLTMFREQYKNEHKSPRSHEVSPPKRGDYVLIHDEWLRRGQWKMGEILGSRDGFQRSVEIRLPSNRTITRPLSLVHKLEVADNSKSEVANIDSNHRGDDANGWDHE